MKKLLLFIVVAICFSACAQNHLCPTYSNSGAKWNSKSAHHHPYGGSKH